MNIEIEIPVKDLKSVLPGLSKIIPRSRTLPILQCVKIILDPDETVHIQATNLDETATATLGKCSSGLSGEIVVPFDELTKLVKGCAGRDYIWVIANGKKTVIRYPLGGGHVDQPVERVDSSEWPPVTIIDKEPITLGDEFKQTLKQAIECASTDSSRHNISGAYLDVSGPKGHYVVGTDGSHLFAGNSFNFKLDASVLVPSRKFLLWPGFMEDGEWKLKSLPEAKKTAPWLQVNSDHWSYLVKQVDGKYPNWKQCVPTPNHRWTQITLDAVATEMIIGAIPLLPGAEQQHQPVQLEIRSGHLYLKASGKTKSEILVETAQVFGKATEISLNRNFLLKALRFGFKEIQIENPVSPLLFITTGKTMVVMPVRGEAAEKFSAANKPKNSPGEVKAPEIAEPSAAANQPTEERKSMPPETFKAPQRGNLKSHETETHNEPSAIDELLEQAEKTKSHLREIFNDLNEMTSTLKRVSKEQKSTDKEINKFRASLRSLQKVEI